MRRVDPRRSCRRQWGRKPPRHPPSAPWLSGGRQAPAGLWDTGLRSSLQLSPSCPPRACRLHAQPQRAGSGLPRLCSPGFSEVQTFLPSARCALGCRWGTENIGIPRRQRASPAGPTPARPAGCSGLHAHGSGNSVGQRPRHRGRAGGAFAEAGTSLPGVSGPFPALLPVVPPALETYFPNPKTLAVS